MSLNSAQKNQQQRSRGRQPSFLAAQRPCCALSGLVIMAMAISGCQSIENSQDNQIDSYQSSTVTDASSSARDPQKVAEIRTRIAAQYIQKNQIDNAQRQLALALEANDRYAPAYDMMGVLLQQEGSAVSLKKADSYFVKAIRLDPDFMQTHNNYGVYLSQMGRYQEAIRQFETAGSTLGYSGRIKALENLGVTALKTDDTELALKTFTRILDNDRNNLTAHIELVDLLLASGQLTQAQDLYTETLMIMGHNALETPRVLFQGIRLAHLENNLIEQENLSSQLLANFPLSPEAKKLKDWLRNPKAKWQ